MREFLPIIVGKLAQQEVFRDRPTASPDLETSKTMIERKRSSRIMRPARASERSRSQTDRPNRNLLRAAIRS